jgi:NlpC/P60 family putative phage cell wall peptidase
VRAADPERVIATARSWLGAPYHDQASLKDVGCDCLGLARGVWREVVGPEPFPIPPYSRDWSETGPHEVLTEGARALMIEIPHAEAAPGALILFRMRPRAIAKHVGILTGSDTFVHAYERLTKIVALHAHAMLAAAHCLCLPVSLDEERRMSGPLATGRLT